MGIFGNRVQSQQNYRRVAEVWMDEYKEYVYKKRPGSKKINMGTNMIYLSFSTLKLAFYFRYKLYR